MSSVMSEKDWETLITSWQESYQQDPKPYAREDSNLDGQPTFKYRYTARGTAKAVFYVTEVSEIELIYGYWVPRSAILYDKDNIVVYAKWCKLKKIQFV